MQSPTGANQLPEDPKEDAPWYIKYGYRALGTFAGGLAILLGALSTIFSIFSPTCILFSIWQMLVGCFVVMVESPCCCAFVENVQTVTQRIESKPLWVKAAVYVGAPLPSIIFCAGFYTIFGGGLIIATGVVYGMLALGKKASREEMARNAQTTFNEPQSSTPYQVTRTSTNRNTNLNKTSHSSYTIDPVKDAAAAWASQAVAGSGSNGYNVNPPAYSSVDTHRNWDQSFVNDSSANPVSSPDPSNPFQ